MNEETIYEGTTQNKFNPNATQNVSNDESTILDATAGQESEATMVAKEGNDTPTNAKASKKGGNAWINVTLGGVSGILLGAGLMYGAKAYAERSEEPSTAETEPQPEDPNASQTDGEGNGGETIATETQVEVAPPADDMSFGEAFAAARAAVGPDGVFVWHGGVYSTHTAEEWNAMSHQQQNGTIAQVPVTTPANQITTPPDDTHTEPGIEPGPASNPGDDVAVVGVDEVDGHMTSFLDVDGDGEADIAIIDVDDNQQLSDVDIVTNGEDIATIADLREMGTTFEGNPYTVDNDNVMAGYEGHEPPIEETPVDNGGTDTTEGSDGYLATLENPETATDMPDYMDNALIDA